MKKLVLFALLAFGFGSQAQGNLNVTVTDSGTAVEGVAVFYYSSANAFFGNGYIASPTYDRFNGISYTNSNGQVNFSLNGITPSDSLFWATKDCNGNFIWSTAITNPSNPNITTALNLSCVPTDCDVLLRTDSIVSLINPNAPLYLIEAFALRDFALTSLNSLMTSSFTLNGQYAGGQRMGNYDSIMFNAPIPSGAIGYCYSRVDSFCTPVCDSMLVRGGIAVNPNPTTCNASYIVDTVNSGLFQGQLIVWEFSSSNGNIINYDWDFGDGTTANGQYPSHNYTSVGVYNVCLSITAVDSAGIDTCVSTFCDTIGFDANGNLVYKGMTGFTINVIDPATVGLEDKVLGNSLSLFPNPATDRAELSWDASLGVQNVTVFSISGQKLMDFQPASNSAEITGLESGAYLVRVSSENAAKTLRLIIE